ncbi:EAL domain-containing protein [Butyrivibrio sp. NC3005]|uniref:EAL domain-containing protein n=1 Tax=Butyrivibrio sp. NC3005 TaxID=1280685 RepID=UPI00042793EF|nr:EAL domain-containing protein [Butyrivibrio sp. NC3005]
MDQQFDRDFVNASTTMDADELTGLMNKRCFIEFAQELVESDLFYSNKYSLIYFNLVHFKYYNVKYSTKEGDKVLIEVGKILKENFEESLVSRFSDDHFVVFTNELNISDRIEIIRDQVSELRSRSRIRIKAGIYEYESNEIEVSSACDYAKIACDSIENNVEQHYCKYDSILQKNAEIEDYVCANIDKALKKENIEVFYQPVIRALTGRLCSMEALARWETKEYGMLKPEQFISALEKSRQISKLDVYIIRKICENLKKRLDAYEDVVPISFNLSRIDFVNCDIFKEVETAVIDNAIPRNLISIEITEGIMVSSKYIQSVIHKFSEAGYYILMDDFGSGYSALNVLKDLEFDEIKFDMAFLKNMNARTVEILTSMVNMAKKIGVHTLAEGVENEDQLRFLCSIGCEKIQGYFYGSASRYDDQLQHLRYFGIMPENQELRVLYDKAGLRDLINENPIALFFDDGKRFELQFSNAAYQKINASPDFSSHEIIEKDMNSTESPLGRKFRNLANRARRTGLIQRMTFVNRNHYFKFSFETLSTSSVGCVHFARIEDATYDDEQKYISNLNEALRNLVLMYDRIYLIDLEQDTEDILATNLVSEKAGDTLLDLQQILAFYREHYIYPEDRKRFSEFCSKEFIINAILQSGRGIYSEDFRVRDDDGSYHWMETNVMILPESNQKKLLACMKTSCWEDEGTMKTFKQLSQAKNYYDEEGRVWENESSLWRSFISSSTLKVFWKDENRRFVGASKSFLDYYGFSSVKDILGKTDEEIGWHIEDEDFKKIEEQVITTGTPSVNIEGKNIVRGKIRSIVVSKFPINKGNKINGLIGYFVDKEEVTKAFGENDYKSETDSVTGYMNIVSMMANLEKYDSGNKTNNQEYIAVMVCVEEYKSIVEEYGDETGKMLIKRVAGIIGKHFDKSAFISRLKDCKFAIWSRNVSSEEIHDKLLDCRKKINAIHEINKNKVNLTAISSFASRNEVSNGQELYELLIKRLYEVRNLELGRKEFDEKVIIFDREKFDDLNELVFMSSTSDYSLVYLNKYGRKLLGLGERESLRGLTCHDIIKSMSTPCTECRLSGCGRDTFTSGVWHIPTLGKDFLGKNTIIPWKGENYFFSMNLCLDDYFKNTGKGFDRFTNGKTLNDITSVLELALEKNDMNSSLELMMSIIGNYCLADKVLFFTRTEKENLILEKSWAREGIEKKEDVQIKVPLTRVLPFYKIFNTGKNIVIPDMEKNKSLGRFLKDGFIKNGVKSLIAVEIKVDDKAVGFLQIDNPCAESLDQNDMTINGVIRIFNMLIQTQSSIEKLQAIGNEDALTGVQNRRAAQKYIQNMDDVGFAIIFGDINGLKKVNDTQGHEAGDKLIRTTAKVLNNQFGANHVFRLGGDEFVSIVEMPNKDDVDSVMEQLRSSFVKNHISIALGAVWKQHPGEDAEALIREADKRMYANKQYMHEERKV